MVSISSCGKFGSTSNFVTSATNKYTEIQKHSSLTRVPDASEQTIRKHFKGKIPEIFSALGRISLNLVLILMILRKSKAVLIAFLLTH